MESIVKMVYKKDLNILKISCNGKAFDVSRIKDIPIEQWVFPFCSKGVKWNGLYEELKAFTERNDFTLHFDSDDTSFEIVKYALSETPAKLIGTNNIVTILYNENPFTTSITVNGNVFNTARIQNRSIDEWINPIQIRDLQWNGIFEELSEFIGTDVYKIYFVGKQEFMKLLIDKCPKNVDVFYRDPKIAEKVNKGKPSLKLSSNTISSATPKMNMESVSNAAKKAAEKLKVTASDSETSENLNRILIKNKFIRKNIMTICAVISIIMAFLPFASFSVKAGDVTGNKISVSGFETLFGISEIKVGSNNSIFGLILFLVPIIIIVMNYIKPLKPFKKYIAVGAPALGIIGEFVTFFDLRGLCKTFIQDEGAKLSSSFGIGFFLILASYILIAVVGLMIYHGMELPKKKRK